MERLNLNSSDFSNFTPAPHTGDVDWSQFRGLSEDEIEVSIYESGQSLPDC